MKWAWKRGLFANQLRMSAVIMIAAVLLHLVLPSEPLRTRAVEPELV